jgi:hypothetical protein
MGNSFAATHSGVVKGFKGYFLNLGHPFTSSAHPRKNAIKMTASPNSTPTGWAANACSNTSVSFIFKFIFLPSAETLIIYSLSFSNRLTIILIVQPLPIM